MILPDVNVLVYAYRREAVDHDAYTAWLTSLVAGQDELAVADHCLTGFLRIVTNPRIFSDPAPTTEALTFVDRLRRAHRGRPVTATPATWDVLAEYIAQDRGIRGNLVPDTYLAALAVSHGCRLATTDRGFARYPGLKFFNPVAAEPAVEPPQWPSREPGSHQSSPASSRQTSDSTRSQSP